MALKQPSYATARALCGPLVSLSRDERLSNSSKSPVWRAFVMLAASMRTLRKSRNIYLVGHVSRVHLLYEALIIIMLTKTYIVVDPWDVVKKVEYVECSSDSSPGTSNISQRNALIPASLKVDKNSVPWCPNPSRLTLLPTLPSSTGRSRLLNWGHLTDVWNGRYRLAHKVETVCGSRSYVVGYRMSLCTSLSTV